MDAIRVAQLGGAKGALKDSKTIFDGMLQILERVLHKYEWTHVPGHSNHPWNELVDSAARI
eukprot:7125987-Pyramimonas_sp.AAC.1